MHIAITDIAETEAHCGIARHALLPDGDHGQLRTLNRARLTKGHTFGAHTHHDCLEWYIFLSGEGEMVVGNETFMVKAGDFVEVELGKVHDLRNDEDDDLVFVTLRTIHPDFVGA